MYWMGKSYINLNDLENAEKTFNQLIKKFPKSEFSPLSMLELGLIKKQSADIKAADAIFSQIQTDYSDDPIAAQAGFERASIKFAMGDTIEAMKIYKQVAEKYPNMDYGEQSIYKIAMYNRLIGKYDNAVSEFKKLTKSNLNSMLAAEAQYRIGEIWMRQDNPDSAITSFILVKDNFAGIEDWFTLSLLNMGECYDKTQNYEKAIETYQAIVALRPDDDFGKTAKRRLKELQK